MQKESTQDYTMSLVLKREAKWKFEMKRVWKGLVERGTGKREYREPEGLKACGTTLPKLSLTAAPHPPPPPPGGNSL